MFCKSGPCFSSKAGLAGTYQFSSSTFPKQTTIRGQWHSLNLWDRYPSCLLNQQWHITWG